MPLTKLTDFKPLQEKVQNLESDLTAARERIAELEAISKRFDQDNAHIIKKFLRLEAERDELRKVVGELVDRLKVQSWAVHCGQFHQWKDQVNCTEKNCEADQVALLAAQKVLAGKEQT